MKIIPSTKMGKEALRILKSNNPIHRERMVLVHYLRGGLNKTDKEIFWIIDDMNNWNDYDRDRTWQQIQSIKTNKFRKNEGRPPSTDLKQHDRILGAGAGASFKNPVPFMGDNTKAHILEPYNDKLFYNAKERKYGINNEMYRGLSPYPDYSNPLLNEFYRTIEGNNHILFVVDIDRIKLLDAFLDAQVIYYGVPYEFDFIKFSGNRGFHLIKKVSIDGNGYDYVLLREMGKWIVNNLGVKIDFSMFNRNHLIRGYCVNFKSGLCSIPVDLEHDTLDDILHKSTSLELSRDNKKQRGDMKK